MDTTNLNKDRKRGRKTGTDTSALVYGKVPPQAKDIEVAVLGALLMNPNSLDDIITIIKPESFYLDAHQKIFSAIVELHHRNMPTDMYTVINNLNTKGELEAVGGVHYFTVLTKEVVNATSIETHARIVQQKFIMREMIRISGELIISAYEGSTDPFELLQDADLQLGRLSEDNIESISSADAVGIEVYKHVEKLRGMEATLTGVPSGFKTLDHVTRGWQPGLIILAARPSVGKSAFALSITNAASAEKVPVLFMSLEMSKKQLVMRLMAAKSQVYLRKMQDGRINDEESKRLYKDGLEQLHRQHKIFIDDSSALDVFRFRSTARRMKRKHGIGLIVVDYLQLMSGTRETKGNREREIAEISRELKKVSKELDIPVIALSQLSREVEKRSGEKQAPRLSDLRESGAIEQDADVVMFLYGPTEDQLKKSFPVNMRNVSIAKHRDGILWDLELLFKNEYQSFLEWDSAGNETPAELGPGNWKPVPTNVALPFKDGSDREEETPF